MFVVDRVYTMLGGNYNYKILYTFGNQAAALYTDIITKVENPHMVVIAWSDAWRKVEPEMIRWVNFYPEHGSLVYDYSHKTREAADKDAGSSRLACVEVKFKQGDGL